MANWVQDQTVALGRRKRLRGTAVIAAALAFVVASVSGAVAQQTIRSIEITGEQRIEEETIRSYLQLREGDQADPGRINEAVKRLFATGLFSDASITPRSDGSLLVEVIENPIISQIAFEGNRTIDDDLLQAQIRSRPRASFSRARAESDAQSILDAYRASGRYSATVEPKIIEEGQNRVALVFEISEGEEVGVSAINFVGNSEYSDRRLRTVIETSESAWWKILATSDNYDADRLEYDKELLRRFYFARGYADFEVISAVAELNPERTGFFITFSVSEGELYDVGDVEVVSSVPGVEAEEFEDLVETDEGDTYDADLVQRTVREFQRHAGEEGLNFLDIRPQGRKRRGENDEPIIDVTYQIVEAPRIYVERIEVEGNSRTLDHVIRREFEFVEGDAFNAYRLQRSKSNIQRLGYFSKVDVETERGSSDDRVVVRTKVEEQSTGDVTFGIGFSTAESVGGQISITERNFLGRGLFVRASASLTGQRSLFDFSFTDPYFLDRNLRAGFDVFHTEIDNQDESSFDRRRTGFRPRVGFPIDENSAIDFNYLIESDELDSIPVTASPLIEQDAGQRLVSALGYDYALDYRNDPNTPTEGFIFRFGQDFAGAGGDAMYIRSEGSVKGYTSFFREDVVTSLELAGGALFGFGDSDSVRIGDRFSLGGDSFRGFESGGVGPRDTNFIGKDTNGNNVFDAGTDTAVNANDSLGGNYYAMVRADVSFPLGLPESFGIHGGVFADAGTIWGLDDTSYTALNPVGGGGAQTFNVDDDLAFRATAGVSLFWTSPFGPLRMNFALPIVKEEEDKTEFFRFSAGTRF